MSLEEDKQLLLDAQANAKAFDAVYEKYYKPIFGYVFRRVADYDAARDIAAETFIKAFLNIKSFKWRNVSLSSWLYKIATNEANQYFRSHKYSPRYLSELSEQHVELIDKKTTEEEKTEMERELKLHEDFIQVQKNLKTLSVKYQEVIALRYFEDKSIWEINEILDKSEGTVKSLLSRGLDKLRQMMGG